MYGASKSTHRVDDVVSGRITPTWRLEAPLVAAAVSPLNWDIVDAMSTVKELMLSPEGIVPEPLVVGLDEVPALAEVDAGAVVVDEDDEQPAATMAAAAATATKPNRGRDLDRPRPCEPGGRPPRPLLSSSIPYPFRHNALGYATVGHRATRVSFRDER
jgi:hypothetical protein